MNNWPINVAKFNADGALEISPQLLRKMCEGLGLLKLHEEPAIVFFRSATPRLCPTLRRGKKICATTMAVTTGVQEQLPPNSVKPLLIYPFARQKTEEKLLLKELELKLKHRCCLHRRNHPGIH